MKAKKVLALLLVACMTLGIAGCGNGNKKPNNGNSNISAEVPEYINTESALPIVKEGNDITLEVMIVNGPLYSNLDSIEDVYFVNAYEEKTNVHIEWIEVSSDAFADQLALRLTKGDLPDVIIKGGVSNSQLYKQAGNSIVVNVLEAIFTELQKTYPEEFPSTT